MQNLFVYVKKYLYLCAQIEIYGTGVCLFIAL